MTTGPDLRPPSQHTYPAGEAPKQRNTVGIIALITALVGAIFAMIPGALILAWVLLPAAFVDRKSTRLNSSHVAISYAVFCLKKKTNRHQYNDMKYIV